MAVLFCNFMLERQQISELLAPFCEGQELAAEQVEYLYIYLNLLLKWNRVINLTAIRQPEQIVRRHFGESLFAARHLLAPGAAESVIDIGSGAGFPGMVLKIFAPAIGLTLVEANGKKATFLRELARSLHFTDVRVVQERAERLSEKASLVTFRAVEKFESILLTAASLVVARRTAGSVDRSRAARDGRFQSCRGNGVRLRFRSRRRGCWQSSGPMRTRIHSRLRVLNKLQTMFHVEHHQIPGLRPINFCFTIATGSSAQNRVAFHST